MTAPENRERRLELIHGFLEQTLSPEELLEMEAILCLEDGARRDLILASALHQELFVLHELPAQTSPMLEVRETGGDSGKHASTLRSSRRLSSKVRESSWTPALVAAASLIGAVLLFLAIRSERRIPVPPRHDSARSHGIGTPEPPPGTSQVPAGTPDAAPERAEEERIRAESVRRLADLERRRSALAQAVPRDSDPRRVEQQKADLGLLEEEKRKIEEEMSLAIEHARRTPRGRTGETVTQEPSAPGPGKEPGNNKVSSVASVDRVEGEGFILRK
ncbi:MAG TPA: hypothetical protein VG457_12545, partial [Planctomycetota bacterium]|nr:hypothetical protein [Planctomycetota bacterium]